MAEKENDLQIGIKQILDEPDAKLTAAEIRENELMVELFKNVAGADEEVDWKELKDILDYYTRKEEPSVAMKMDGVNATPEQTPNQNNLITAILALICGTICKDTPLADVIPQPQENALIQSYHPETRSKGFSKDVCRSMIAMLDTDRTGKLNYEEFKRLWTAIRNWKNVFKQYDKTQSGTLTGFELREALSSAGYSINNHILNILMHRYGNKDNEIEFDDFIMCAVKLKMMIELFKEVSSGTKKASFSLDDWIENTLYA